MKNTMMLIIMAVTFNMQPVTCDPEPDPAPALDIDDSSEEADPFDVEEPGCPRIAQLPEINPIALMGEWRVPYMSEHWIRFMAKSMHGKNMKKSSLSSACMKIIVKPMPENQSYNNASIWVHTKCPRTGAEVNLGCETVDDINAKLFCTDMRGKTLERDSHVLVVDTDNATYALIVRCFPRNGMNWAIFSKVKVLDHNIIKGLLARVEEMGFKLRNIIQVPQEKCF